MRKLSVATDFEENVMNNSLQRNPIRILLGLVTAVFMLSDIFAGTVGAADYYVSPNGFDSNDRGTSSAPWKTFNFAIPRLRPGDTLLLKNGTYTTSNSGFPNINCSTNAKNGTDSQRITIKAENERQAFFNGDGSADIFQIYNCSYWSIEGLRIESADSTAGFGASVFLESSSQITVRRLLVAHNNRYRNSHLIAILHTKSSLFEENELYYFHRHGFVLGASDNNIFRRNYINSRGYVDIGGGYSSASPGRGEAAIAIYPGSNNIVENNISEGNLAAINIEADGTSKNNRFFGNISINDIFGALIKARGDTADFQPQDTFIKDLVVVNPAGLGAYFRGNKNTRCENCSVLGGGGGVLADVESVYPGDGIYSVFISNTLVAKTSGYGFQFGKQTNWGVDYSYAYNNAVNYADGVNPTNVPSINDVSKIASSTCTVFIPIGSPLKSTGKSTTDIGANVLYRYQDGSLTNQPLWNPTTGEFPHGAIIPGVNDIPGSSAFDVHKRLNVNTNGCSLSSSNIATSLSTTVIPSAPRNLQALSR
jgi:Right handed beta helix region